MKEFVFIFCLIFCVYILILRRVLILWKHKHIEPINIPNNISTITDLKKYLLDNHFQYPELIQIDEGKFGNELLIITKTCSHSLTLEDNCIYINKSNYFKGLDLKEEKACGESFVLHTYLKKLFGDSSIDTYKKYKHFKNITKYKIFALLIIIVAVASTFFLESDYYKSNGISESYLDYSNTLKIGKAFDEYFAGSYEWESFKVDGETFVNCTGWYYNTDKESIDALVQFKILDDNRNFEVFAVELNEQPLSLLEIDLFLKNVFGNNENNNSTINNVNTENSSVPVDNNNSQIQNTTEDDISSVVYNGYLSQFNNEYTIGEAFDGFFTKTEWRSYESVGSSYVQCLGTLKDNTTNENSEIIITFTVYDDNTFDLADMQIDGEETSDFDKITVFSAIYNIDTSDSNLIPNTSTSYDDLINDPDNPFAGIIVDYDNPSEDSELSSGVKDSYLAFYSTDKTIGEAFEEYFDDEEWFIAEETENTRSVIFKGSYTTKVTGTFYTFGAIFTVDLTNNTFSLDAMGNDGEILGPLDMSVMLNLIYGR